MKIKITSPNIKDVERRLGNFKEKAPNVLSNVLNRVISRVKTVTPRAISKKYKITSANFKKWIKYSKVSKKNLNAWYSANSYPLSISKYFKAKPNKVQSFKGKTLKQIKKLPSVKTMVEQGNGFTTQAGAFIQRMENGHTGVFKRNDDSKKISEIKGPAAGSVLSSEDIIKEVRQEADKVLNKRLEHEINRVLGR